MYMFYYFYIYSNIFLTIFADQEQYFKIRDMIKAS